MYDILLVSKKLVSLTVIISVVSPVVFVNRKLRKNGLEILVDNSAVRMTRLSTFSSVKLLGLPGNKDKFLADR